MYKQFLFIIFLLCSLAGFSQQYSFIEYSLDEGLSQSQVRCLFQDKVGYIWVGTLSGASKFDGQDFTNYSKIDGLMFNQINVITQKEDGQMVFGGLGGISFLSASGFQNFTFSGDFEDTRVNDICEKNDGSLSIGTNKGMVIFNNGVFDYSMNVNPLSQKIKKIAITGSKQGIVAGENEIVHQSDQGSKVIFEAENYQVMDMELVNDDCFWLATKDSGILKVCNGNVVEKYTGRDGLINNVITELYSDSQGNIWASSRWGCSRFDGSDFLNFTEHNGLPTPDITCVLEDFEGNIWLGTEGSGLLRFTSESYTNYSLEDGLSSELIMSITEDQENNIWISSYDAGVSKISPDGIENFDLSEMFGNNRVWTSLCDRKGNLWFGTSNGLVKYDGTTFSSLNTEDGLQNRKVYSLYEDDEGIIWVGTYKGVNYFENGELKKLTPPDEFTISKTRSIVKNNSNQMWFATVQGVTMFDGKQFVSIAEEDGLSDNSVYDIEVDSKDNLWIGTASGLCLLRGNKVEKLRVDLKSSSNRINFLSKDRNNLFIGTNNGLYTLDLDAFYTKGSAEFNHISQEDGLSGLETNQNATFIDSEQFLWVGTTNGVTKINYLAEERQAILSKPRIEIIDIKLNLEDVDWSDFNADVDSLSGLPKAVSVPHNRNHFTFYYTGLGFRYPKDVQYQYMMEGFDDTWQPLTKTEIATYSNLPFDSFTFKVRSSYRNGEWSEVASSSFSISPPFWLAWWFIVLEVLFVSSIVWYIYQRRKKVLLTQIEKDKFEYESKMRALEQQTLNSSLNRHFIFNALNSIQYYINRKDRVSANKYLSSFAKLIRKNLDSSQTNTTTLREELERLDLYLVLEHMRFRDKFEYSIEVDPAIDQDFVKVPSMLLQPFLENSIWHGILPKNEPGELLVQISKKDDKIEFTITDNGIGIETSLRNKSDEVNHSSKGMSITMGRIELINKSASETVQLLGPYEIRDDNDNVSGTQVRIIMPVNFHEIYSN